MARPERTDLRARYSLLSGDLFSPVGLGHYKLESFGFWRRKSCIKGVAVGTAETARFSGEKDECLQTAFV